MASIQSLFQDTADVSDDAALGQSRESLTVLESDEWTIRRGESLVRDSKNLRATLLGTFREKSLVASDLFGMMFDPQSKFADNPRNRKLRQFLGAMRDTPEYHKLHAETQMDVLASQIATMTVAKRFSRFINEEQDEPTDEGSDSKAEIAQAAMEAVTTALLDTQDAKLAAKAFGVGEGQGLNLPKDEVAKLFKQVRASKRLRQIAIHAGRFRKLAEALQSRRMTRGTEEMIGIHTGGEIEHLLPTELSMLSLSPELAMSRIAERKAICRQMAGVEKVGKGPIVVVVDESGSMAGPNIIAAKALALALAWVAKSQSRDCLLVGFSDSYDVNETLLRGKVDPSKVADWCDHFYSGGTSANVMTTHLPNNWSRYSFPDGATDIILITDGCLSIHDKGIAAINAFKERTQAKIHSIAIESTVGPFRKVTDYYHEAGPLTEDDAGVQHALQVGA
jgi:uncharacterized protein with von Willebrand factor type A (vWA) domain